MKLKKKNLCTKAFCKFFNVSLEKIIAASKNEGSDTVAFSSVENINNLNSKRSQIEAFLSGVSSDDAFSEPDTIDPICRRISSLDSKISLWNIYCQTILVDAQIDIPSSEYFIKIWNLSFPHLSSVLLSLI